MKKKIKNIKIKDRYIPSFNENYPPIRCVPSSKKTYDSEMMCFGIISISLIILFLQFSGYMIINGIYVPTMEMKCREEAINNYGFNYPEECFYSFGGKCSCFERRRDVDCTYIMGNNEDRYSPLNGCYIQTIYINERFKLNG